MKKTTIKKIIDGKDIYYYVDFGGYTSVDLVGHYFWSKKQAEEYADYWNNNKI